MFVLLDVSYVLKDISNFFFDAV